MAAEPVLRPEKDQTLSGTIEAEEIYQAAGSKGRAPTGDPKPLGRDARRRGLKKGPGRGRADKDTPCIITWVARTGKAILQGQDFTTKTVEHAAQTALEKRKIHYDLPSINSFLLANC